MLKDQSNEASLKVLQTHYLRDNEKNWFDVVDRICKEFEKIDKPIIPYLRYALENKIICFNTPALMNLGYSNMCSACFTLTVEDSLDDIYGKLKLISKIFKEGGGVGLSLSKLREKGAPIKGGGTSPGIIAWMEQFDQMVESVKQGGRRRGALLITLPYYHPDIEDFIKAKSIEYIKEKYNIEDNKEAELLYSKVKPFKNMNISIGIDENFINAVEQNKEIELISPYNNKVVKRINAKNLMGKILNYSIKGEPGFLFMDNAEKDNPMPSEGKIDTSNPCGEVLLPSSNIAGACNLVTINLPSLFKNKDDYSFNNRDFLLYIILRIADDLIELNYAVTPEITKKNKKFRPVGIGVMDLATIFVRNNCRYGDDKSVEITDTIFKTLRQGLVKASIQLAKERGSIKEKPNNILKGIEDNEIIEQYNKYGIRNCALMAMPPTGATGLLYKVNGTGIEPYFGIVYNRFVRGSKYLLINKEFINSNWFKSLSDEKQEELLDNILKNKGSIQDIDRIPKYIKNVFVTTSDLTIQEHLNIVNTIIKYTDMSISKTINLPEDFNIEFDNLFNFVKNAHKFNLKGITFFHPKSLIGSIVTYKQAVNKRVKRPEILLSKSKKTKWNNKSIYINAGFTEDNSLLEVFIQAGKPGDDFHSLCWAVGWLISKYIQLGGDLNKMFDKMMGIGGAEVVYTGKNSYLSFVDFLFKQILSLTSNVVKLICPNCNKRTYGYIDGCFTCNNCGYSKCG